MTCKILAFEYFLQKCKSDKVYVEHVYNVHCTCMWETCVRQGGTCTSWSSVWQSWHSMQSLYTQCMLVLNQDLLLFRHFKKIVFSQERRDVSRKLFYSQETRDIPRKYFVCPGKKKTFQETSLHLVSGT